MTITQFVKAAGIAAVPEVEWDLKVPEVVTTGVIAGTQAEPTQQTGSIAPTPAGVRVMVAAGGSGVMEAVGVSVEEGVVEEVVVEVVEGVGLAVAPCDLDVVGLGVREGEGVFVKREGHSQPLIAWPLPSLT